QASRQIVPASLAYGRAPAQIGVNRREIRDGKSVIGVNPGGPVAPYVDALCVLDSKQKPFALLFSHACHPTTLGGESLEITADWPGYACRYLRKKTNIMPLFLQGCAGNINPHPRGTFEWAEKHGETIAEAAIEAMDSALPID